MPSMISTLKKAISLQYEYATEYFTESKYPFGFSASTCIAISLGSLYAAYYVLFIAKRPTLAGNTKMTQFLLSHCPALRHRFWPTFWCPGFRAQTILRTLFMSCPEVPRTKQFLNMDDGGHVALDWSEKDSEKMTFNEFESQPIILILPGIVGNDQQSYVLHMMKRATQLGYRTVVFSSRGNGGAALKTSRTYNACNTDDLRHVINHIKERYPSIPLLAVGVSLGGMVLTNYLAKYASNTRLIAGMTISAPWNAHKSTVELEKFKNIHLFNHTLCNELKATMKRHATVFEKIYDLDYIYKSRTIREFDERFTAPQFGYASCEQYYDASRIDSKVHLIKTPLLALNAADDPFSPECSVPMEGAARSQCVMIALTSRGGHMGFLEEFYPRHTSYMYRVFAEYVTAMFQHGGSLSEET